MCVCVCVGITTQPKIYIIFLYIPITKFSLLLKCIKRTNISNSPKTITTPQHILSVKTRRIILLHFFNFSNTKHNIILIKCLYLKIEEHLLRDEKEKRYVWFICDCETLKVHIIKMYIMRTPPTTVEEQNHKLYFELTLKSNQTEYRSRNDCNATSEKYIRVMWTREINTSNTLNAVKCYLFVI